ncbi:hypothetical protein BGZ65_012915, partial [Modicella reniformis]
MLHVVCKGNLEVFFCGSEERGDQRMVDYASSWIAGRDIDEYPHLVGVLQGLTNVVIGLPDIVLKTLPDITKSLGLEDRILTPALVRRLLRQHKSQWSTITPGDTCVEMLKYCIQDDKISDLEGLPLLPLAGGQWVEFSTRAASSRYLVSPMIFDALSYSKEGLVDIDIDVSLVQRFRGFRGFREGTEFREGADFSIYWSSMRVAVIGARIND